MGILKNKVLHQLFAILVGIFVANLTPPEGLSHEAMVALGVLSGAIINWILVPIPDYATTMGMCALWAILKVLPFNVVFSPFSSTTFWLILGALGLGVGIAKAGLVHRAAALAFKYFPPTYNGQILALMTTGLVISPTMPSTTAKSAMFGTVVKSMGEMLGLERKSPGMGGLMLAMFMCIGAAGPIYMSASYFSWILLGSIPAEYAQSITWIKWFLTSLPWTICIMIITYLSIVTMYKANCSLSREEAMEKYSEYYKPLKKNELMTVCILLLCMFFWILERVLDIPSVYPAILGLVAMIALRLITVQDFITKIPWNMVIHIGGIISVASVVGKLGIDKWISSTFAPYVSTVASNTYLFILALCIFVFLCRFIVASVTASIALFTTILAPFCIAAGVSPFIGGMIVYIMMSVWFLPYQNVQFITAFVASGGEEYVGYRQTLKFNVVYSISSALLMVASVPWWRLLGFIK